MRCCPFQIRSILLWRRTYCGLPPAQSIKLSWSSSHRAAALVLIAADREIQLKRLAQALGEKKLRMATRKKPKRGQV